MHIDTSSPCALGESVLRMLACLYVQMRNKLALRTPSLRPTPAEQMQTPVSAQEQEKERARLIEHKQISIRRMTMPIGSRETDCIG